MNNPDQIVFFGEVMDWTRNDVDAIQERIAEGDYINFVRYLAQTAWVGEVLLEDYQPIISIPPFHPEELLPELHNDLMVILPDEDLHRFYDMLAENTSLQAIAFDGQVRIVCCDIDCPVCSPARKN